MNICVKIAFVSSVFLVPGWTAWGRAPAGEATPNIDVIAADAPPEPAQSDLSWMRGANYVPSYARHDVQTWMDDDPAVIDRELGYAAKLKPNVGRVFLQVAVYETAPQRFRDNFQNLLALCAKHQLQLMPVLFDSCFDPQAVDPKDYHDKKWMPSPGFSRLGGLELNSDCPKVDGGVAHDSTIADTKFVGVNPQPGGTPVSLHTHTHNGGAL